MAPENFGQEIVSSAEEEQLKVSIKNGIPHSSRKHILYPLLHEHTWDDTIIPDSIRRDVLLAAAQEWDIQGHGSLTESWERNGDEIARGILREQDPEWVERQKPYVPEKK